jgi:hypothetical protein
MLYTYYERTIYSQFNHRHEQCSNRSFYTGDRTVRNVLKPIITSDLLGPDSLGSSLVTTLDETLVANELGVDLCVYACQ